MSAEDEAEFASLFSATSRYGSKLDTKARVKAERRAAMTDKQRSRGGGPSRSLQMNFRCTPDFKRRAVGLSGHMTAKSGRDVSMADLFEEALTALAEREGYTGGSDASR